MFVLATAVAGAEAAALVSQPTISWGLQTARERGTTIAPRTPATDPEPRIDEVGDRGAGACSGGGELEKSRLTGHGEVLGSVAPLGAGRTVDPT
jgi:hypothetical protein